MEDKKEEFCSTSVLPDLGIEFNEGFKYDIKKIRQSEDAFLMFLNLVGSRDKEYTKTKKELEKYQRLAQNRKAATIIMTVAELVLAIGTGGIFSVEKYAVLFGLIIAVGILLTFIGLYFTFSDKED